MSTNDTQTPGAAPTEDKPALSRRALLGSAAGVAAIAAQAAPARAAPARAEAVRPGPSAAAGGLKYRAFLRANQRPDLAQVTLDPLGTHRVLVRTTACQCCYSIVGQAFPGGRADADMRPRVLGHGGVGIVEAVGVGVRRVKPGDQVVVSNTPQCGACYNCIRNRPDLCKMRGFSSDLEPIGKLNDGSPVIQHNNEGGFGDYMVPFEEFCVPVDTKVSPAELSMLGCVGACGLGTVLSLAPVHAGAIVAVFGCGPVGLSAIQGARIQGADQVIAIEPIAERRALATKFGATTVLDPRAEGDKLVARIKDLCKGWTDRKFTGARWTKDVNADNNQLGADFVIECVGGDRGYESRPTQSPDPTGILPLRQAYDVTSEGGVLITPSVGQRGNIDFPAGRWTNSNRTHISSQFGGTHPMRDFPRYANLVERGLFDAKSMVTMDVPLDQVKDAFQAVADRSTVGAVVTWKS